MKKITLTLFLIILSSIGITLIVKQCIESEKNKEKTQNINAPFEWFEFDTTPEPSDIIPFTDKNVSDTAFHMWSWQKFLSLTRTNKSKSPFENLIQVDNNSNKIGTIIELNDSTQAGSGAVLYDSLSRSIYYTIHQNETMYSFQQKYLPIFASIVDSFKNSTNRNLLVQNTLNKKGYDTLNLPVGSILIKTSWILLSSLPKHKISNYYITDGLILSSKGQDTVKIALLGMHIVGRVTNHPELIWATYEHSELTPNYDWSNRNYPDMGKVLSNKNYLFYAANTNINSCAMANLPCSQAQFNSVFNLYPYGMAKSFMSDSLPNHRDKVNNSHITSLSKSVYGYLKQQVGVWKHYSYKGSVWLDAINSTFKPGFETIGNLSNPSLNGARAISNITMETYTQLFFSGNYTSGSMNCFGCHTTVDFANAINGGQLNYNLSLSHSFRNGLFQRVSDMSKENKK